MSIKLKIGLSACLAGENVRFDAGHRKDTILLAELGKTFEFVTFCPEIAIGMGVPRQTIRLVKKENAIRALGVKEPGTDVTDALSNITPMHHEWINRLSGYIVKKGSPSCGMERVRIYEEDRVNPVGRGLFTQQLMQEYPLLPVEEEGRLKNPLLLDSFIQRIYAYDKWRELSNHGLTPRTLIEFHTQYKMVLLSRSQPNYRKLGRLVAGVSGKNIKELSHTYIALFMETLKKTASRNNHVNVLQHLQGFLKNQISDADKKDLVFAVEKYGKGELPLIAPLILLNSHFQKNKHSFIEKTLYLNPYPVELGIYTKL